MNLSKFFILLLQHFMSFVRSMPGNHSDLTADYWNKTLPIYMLFASAAYCPHILLPNPVFPCGFQRGASGGMISYTNACDPDGIANSTQFYSVYQDPNTTAAGTVYMTNACFS